MAKLIPLNTLNDILVGVPAADIVTAIQLPNDILEIRRKSYKKVQQYKGTLDFLNLAEGTVLVTIKGSSTSMIINMLHVVDLQPITNSPLDGTRLIFSKESKAHHIDVIDTIVSIDSNVVCCTDGGTDICGSLVDPVGAVTVLRDVLDTFTFLFAVQADLGGGEYITRMSIAGNPPLPDTVIQWFDLATGNILRNYNVTGGVTFFDFQYNIAESSMFKVPSEYRGFIDPAPSALLGGGGSIPMGISGGGTLDLQALDVATISKYTLTHSLFGGTYEVDLATGNPMKDGLAYWCIAGGDVNNIEFITPTALALPTQLNAHIEFNNGCPPLDLEYIWDTVNGIFTLN